jgi:ABC-2 type transport system permease protein
MTVHVIRREYVEIVRRKSFVISTVVAPVLMAAFFLAPVLLSFFVPSQQFLMAVVDQTGEVGAAFIAALDDTLSDGRAKYVATQVPATGARFERARDEAVAGVRAGSLDIVVAIPETVFDDGGAGYITKEVRNFQILDDLESDLTDIVMRRRLAREGVDYERVASLTTPVRLEMSQITAKGGVEKKDFLTEWAVVFVFVMILYASLLTWGVTISRGILEEKSSRVIEVLLSSVRPRQLLFGKLIGIGLAGLTQFAVWSLAGIALTGMGGAMALSVMASVDIPPSVWLYFVGFFVLGFLLYASIFSVVGSICSNEQDAQQLQGIVTLPMIIPLLTLMLIIQNPNGPIAVVLSFIPLFTPMIMMARVVIVPPPLWQVLLSLALLAVSIYLAVSFSARVFRVGILMYGKRPSLREVIRWYRLAG